MALFKRIIDIIQADISSRLDKLENRQNKREQQRQNKYHYKESSYGNEHKSSYNNSGYKESKPSNRDDKLAQYYANLEIPYGSDLETAKKAWKELLKKYHPDRHSNEPAKREISNNLTSKLNEAFKEIEKHLKQN